MLELEIKYAKEEEKNCRKKYKSQKKEYERESDTKGKKRRFNRIVEKVANIVSMK